MEARPGTLTLRLSACSRTNDGWPPIQVHTSCGRQRGRGDLAACGAFPGRARTGARAAHRLAATRLVALPPQILESSTCSSRRMRGIQLRSLPNWQTSSGRSLLCPSSRRLAGHLVEFNEKCGKITRHSDKVTDLERRGGTCVFRMWEFSEEETPAPFHR